MEHELNDELEGVISESSLPELTELLRRIADEIELRMMQEAT